MKNPSTSSPPRKRGSRSMRNIWIPAFETVDFLDRKDPPLWKRGARGDFANGSFRQIPLDPPFSKGEVACHSNCDAFIDSLVRGNDSSDHRWTISTGCEGPSMTRAPRKALSTTDHSRDGAGLSYVYPVVSRRAGGVSVGINLNTNNACNWRCIYCQVPDLVRGAAPPVDLPNWKTNCAVSCMNCCTATSLRAACRPACAASTTSPSPATANRPAPGVRRSSK